MRAKSDQPPAVSASDGFHLVAGKCHRHLRPRNIPSPNPIGLLLLQDQMIGEERSKADFRAGAWQQRENECECPWNSRFYHCWEGLLWAPVHGTSARWRPAAHGKLIRRLARGMGPAGSRQNSGLGQEKGALAFIDRPQKLNDEVSW